MALVHVVLQGEHLSAIAQANGFLTNRPIWEHPKNAALRSQRDSPHLLRAGDELFIPDKVPRVASAATAASHRFVAKLDRLALHLKLLDATEHPQANVHVELRAGSSETKAQTSGDGKVKGEIPRSTLAARLVVLGSGPEPAESPSFEFALRVGGLEPIDTDEGWIQRLNNLGYLVAPEDDRDADELRSAIEEFQCDHGMQVTGLQDGKTKAKLVEIYGC